MKVKAINPAVHTDVTSPLQLINNCYLNKTCLFVSCETDKADASNMTCEIWPGVTGFNEDYFNNELEGLTNHSTGWTYNTTCQYYHSEGSNMLNLLIYFNF